MTGREPEDVTVELARELAGIAGVMLRPAPLDVTLQRIVHVAARAITGCDAAGMCEVIGEPSRTAPTSPVITELDRAQAELGEGPCWDALTQDSVYVQDMLDMSPWPHFAPLAAAAGLRTAFAFRLLDGNDPVGVLQLYSRRPDAFDATARAQALILSSYAGMALGLAQRAQNERDKIDNLQQALAYRDVIGQAQGILMERERITGAAAFALLRRASQHLNVKLRDVAQELVDTGLMADAHEAPVKGKTDALE